MHIHRKYHMNRTFKENQYLRIILLASVLCAPSIFLYCQFLWSPVVFDDQYFFDGTVHSQYLGKIFSFDLRWLPYATFEWTRSLLGLDLIWFHLGNLILHCATSISLFLFLRRLFNLVLSEKSEVSSTLSPFWLAFFGALIFSLHPASVYAVAYLSQRSILMATFFTLWTWRLYMEGLTRQNHLWLLASCITYLLAVLSKEHAIMASAIPIILLFLVSTVPLRQNFKLVWPTFVLYGLIALFVVYQIKTKHILGQAYEPLAANFVSKFGNDFDKNLTYPLSILTQSYLFFKYLWVWIAPSPAWMSIDIYQNFAHHLWSWPESAGFIGFILYPLISIRLLIHKGINGLLGFALLCPWLLFATELSTVRIQEAFVLYRSYLWMAGSFAALPFICKKMTEKQATVLLLSLAIFLMPLSWLRLRSFSHPLLLWDDAARLVLYSDKYYPGMERIFYNRGYFFNHQTKYLDAIEDYTKSIKLAGDTGYLSPKSYNNRGAAYYELRQYEQALTDFNKTIELDPTYSKAHFGKARVLESMKQFEVAAKSYDRACELGETEACKK
jgi:protein O-mannosyl-transferase